MISFDTINVIIGRGSRVHKIARMIGHGSGYETMCGLDNRPLTTSFYARYRSFAQTTRPVDCEHCLNR